MLEVPLLSRTRTAQGLFGRSSFIAAPQHNSRLVEPEVLVIFHVIVPLLSACVFCRLFESNSDGLSV